ncbi:MAG: MFS transporter [Pyrinomonadaceae bacterium]|nr:MFS transporter [Pyrinomonadaceae bacterium]
MGDNGTSSGLRFWRRYRGLPPTVFALSVVSFLNDTSSEIIYPLLPAFLFLTLGATPFAIGLIEGLAESVASILKLFSGYLSDKFGNRKLPVFLGYSLAGIVRPLLAFVTTWQHVLVVRMTDRIGKGIRGAPRDALLASEVPEERRGLAFGFNRAADHLGAVVGPVVAFLLLTYLADDPTNPTALEYQRVFLYASIPVAIGLFAIVFFVHEHKHPEEPKDEPPIKFSIKEFDPNFRRYLIVIALFTLSNSTDAFLLLRAEQSGIAPAMLPLLWMALHFSKVLSSLIGGDLSDKLGRKTMIFAGWLIYAAVYIGFAFITEPWQAWLLFIVYGFYFGLTEGVEKALVADMVDDEKRGTAFGFYNLAFGITVFPASLLFGFMWSQFGVESAFILSSVISLMAAMFFLSIKPRRVA